MAYTVLGLAAIVALAALVLLPIHRALQSRQKANAWGCSPPPKNLQPWWDIIGLGVLRSSLAAAAEGSFPFYFVSSRDKVSQHYGRTVRTHTSMLGGNRFITTTDPRNVKAILASQFDHFGLDSRRPSFEPLLGPGIFTTDGALWSHSRSLLKPAFLKDHITRLDGLASEFRKFVEAVNSTTLVSEQIFPPVAPNHQSTPTEGTWTRPIDLQPLFFKLTFDNSTRFLLGESAGSLTTLLRAQPADAKDDFEAAFDAAQNWIVKRNSAGPFYWTVNPREFQAACKSCHDFIDTHVHRVLQAQQDAKTDPAADPPTKYLLLEELCRETRDPLELRYQLLHILLAGRDTTASSLGFLFWSLARHPAVFTTLRTAVLAHFGPDPTADISFEQLKACHPVQHALLETVRLYPIVPANARTAARDTTLPFGGGPAGEDKIFIPKGTAVGYSVFVMHRDPELWGADANEFRPARWQGRKFGWEFLPFNGGPRTCLGQQFALTTMGYVLVRMLQEFDAIEFVGEKAQGAEPGMSVALTMKGMGCLVQLRKAGAAA